MSHPPLHGGQSLGVGFVAHHSSSCRSPWRVFRPSSSSSSSSFFFFLLERCVLWGGGGGGGVEVCVLFSGGGGVLSCSFSLWLKLCSFFRTWAVSSFGHWLFSSFGLGLCPLLVLVLGCVLFWS